MSSTPPRLIALLFEYATLNGGERSMLAALDWLRENDRHCEFVAIAPSIGRLGDAFRERGILVRNWSWQDDQGKRLSVDEIESSIRSIVASLQPQLLHANSLAMGRLVGRLASRLEIPTTAHVRDIIKLSAAAIKDLNRNCQLVAVSQATREFHIAQGVDASRIKVVCNGIDLNQFQPRMKTGWLHAELGLPYSADDQIQSSDQSHPASDDGLGTSPSKGRQARLIATIGQIGLRKGQDVLAAAVPAIIEHAEDSHFLLIGERNSQKEESVSFERNIHRAFELAGQSSRLHALGHRDDVHKLLNEIDLLIHPANQEPFGRVLLEATASGVPIVATNVGGTSEIVLDDVTGFLIPHHDSNALATAAIRVLTDETLADRFRIAARERAEREFPISVAAQRLANLWDNVLKTAPTPSQ